MTRKREEYEELINNSQLFTITDKTSDSYATEKKYLLAIVCEYYKQYIWYEDSFHGVEFLDAFNSCINSYNLQKGKFINFLSFVVSKNSRRATARQKNNEMRLGIKINVRDEKMSRKLIYFAENRNWDISKNDTIKKLSELTGFSADKVRKLLILNKETRKAEVKIDTEENSLNLYDLLTDGRTPETEYIENESYTEMLKKIHAVVEKMSERKQRIISALMTAILIETGINDMIHKEHISQYSFFDNKIYSELLNTNTILSDKDIADRLNVSNAYVCKIKKEFIGIIATIKQ